MPQEFTLQPSPTRANAFAHSTVPGYAVGLWTPTLLLGSTEVTSYTYRRATYVKIGRIVHLECSIIIGTEGAGSGNVNITGLPFNRTVEASGGSLASISNNVHWVLDGAVTVIAIQARLINAGISFFYWDAATNHSYGTALTQAHVGDGDTLDFCIWYPTTDEI